MLLVFSFSVVVVTELLMMVVEDRNRMNSSKIFNSSISFRLSSKIKFNFFAIFFFLFIHKTSIYTSSKHLVDVLLLHDLYFFMFGIDGRFYR